MIGLWIATEALTGYDVLYLGSALPPASKPGHYNQQGMFDV